MRGTTATTRKVVTVVGVGALLLLAASGASAATHRPFHHRTHHVPATFAVQQILSGMSLSHSFTPQGSSTSQTEPLTKPDDLTRLGAHLFVAFQNGVQPEGTASKDGNLDSTVVEFGLGGNVFNQWDVAGKIDGLTADPQLHGLIATVNEDGNSALDTIIPSATPVVTPYAYSAPLSNAGGTDAISIYHGNIYVSASAPGNTGTPATPTPAVYVVTLDPSTQMATVAGLFNDQDTATIANVGATLGQSMTLNLSDSDSNAVVPHGASRFGGSFELTSQGDYEQIYVKDPGAPDQQLSVLTLSQPVDDTVWPRSVSGRLYSTDSTNDTIDVVTGPFDRRTPIVVATPCGANAAPSTCPAPPQWPANYLATLDPWNGQVTQLLVTGATYTPQGGLLFVSGSPADQDQQL